MSRLIDFRSWYVWCAVFMSLGCALFLLIHLSHWINQQTYEGVTLTVLFLFLGVGVLLLIYSEHFGLFYSIGKDKDGRKTLGSPRIYHNHSRRVSQETDVGSEAGSVTGFRSNSRVHVLDINDLPDPDPEFAPPPAYDDETLDVAPPPYSYAVYTVCDEVPGPTPIETEIQT